MTEQSKSGPSGATIAGPLVPRQAFPLLMARDIAYLDSAASAQKPKIVLDRLRNFYETSYANIHRAVYPLSEEATGAYEGARAQVAEFLGAGSPDSIVFTRNATEAVNLVANAFGGSRLQRGDRILLTTLEHHANIVPWQLLRDRLGLELLVAPIDGAGDLDLDAFDRLLTRGPKLVAVTAASNALGTRTPIKDIVARAHRAGAVVVVDAAQAAPHFAIDVAAWDCDFLVFTGHKLYGPDGIGVLYGRPEVLASMPPWQGGGDMILSVAFEKTL
ncbi:MAG: aminotransferase class V-fold PLP-dependent enzyme, partial [Dongiaceae bacterium]